VRERESAMRVEENLKTLKNETLREYAHVRSEKRGGEKNRKRENERQRESVRKRDRKEKGSG